MFLTKDHQVSRRAFLLGGTSLALAGCTTSNFDTNPGTATAKVVWNYYFGKGEVAKTPREAVLAVPYASIGLQIGRSPQLLVVLSTTNGAKQTWASSDGYVITTLYGRITSTSGFPYDRTGTNLSGPDPFQPGRFIPGKDVKTHFTLDYDEKIGFEVPATSRLRYLRDETIKIIGVNHVTEVYEEEIAVATYRWKVKNHYWRDKVTGYVWRSRQIIHPRQKRPFTIETLRPANSDPAWAYHGLVQASKK